MGDSLPFLYLTSGHFFDFKNLLGLSRFLTPPTFYIDGWMGWMDGWSVHFFFGPYLENYYVIFLNCFSSLKYMFLHIFWNILRKKSEYSFFQNIRPKSSTTFFRKFFQGFLNFSKATRYIFLIVLVPLEE